MPFALGLVRKLAGGGREIYAADDHLLSPGNHSKYLAGHVVYPSPRSDTAGLLAELERIAREHEIDVVVPAFEEAFYISTQLERLSRVTKVFVSPFGTLARLHDKGLGSGDGAGRGPGLIADPRACVDRQLEARLALERVADLPSRQRRLFALQLAGLSYAETAVVTGDSVRTVDRQLRRAHACVRGQPD
jgi:DNA-binding CsgD family transcriptional regulator